MPTSSFSTRIFSTYLLQKALRRKKKSKITEREREIDPSPLKIKWRRKHNKSMEEKISKSRHSCSLNLSSNAVLTPSCSPSSSSPFNQLTHIVPLSNRLA